MTKSISAMQRFRAIGFYFATSLALYSEHNVTQDVVLLRANWEE